MEDLQELSDFFARANSSAFEEKLLFAIDALRKAELIIFVGMGSSGTLAKYGARYFSNMGHFAVGLEDALYPIESFHWKNTVVMAFSESGETERLIENIGALLADANTRLSDIKAVIAYIRDYSDRHTVERVLKAKLGDVPTVITLAKVCRPQWLVEAECIACKDE